MGCESVNPTAGRGVVLPVAPERFKPVAVGFRENVRAAVEVGPAENRTMYWRVSIAGNCRARMVYVPGEFRQLPSTLRMLPCAS